MKIWNAYGSEHSMNLVMIGCFKDIGDAISAKDAIEELQEYFTEHNPDGRTYSDDVMRKLSKLKIHSMGAGELEQFTYDFSLETESSKVIIKTDEVDVSALMKVLLERGAKIEVYSAHFNSEDDSQE